MRALNICLFLLILALTGCTEIRVEGDAKVFQASALGSTIRIVAGLGLIGLGIVVFIGSILPDRKPKHRVAKPNEKLSTGQRVGLALFGGAMGFVGFFLAAISLLFPSKLHVTVHPDRVVMASTYSQTGGREVVVPYAGLSSVELRQEPGVVGKMQTFLVFTLKSGKVVRQDAGNNERQAVEAIRQALAEYQKSAPATESNVALVEPSKSTDSVRVGNLQPREAASVPAAPKTIGQLTTDPPKDKEYKLKRYIITAPKPPGYRLVSPNDSIEVGVKLKASVGPTWFYVTVVALNDDGTITCNWDDFPSFTYKMMREDLITVDEKAASDTTSATSSPTTIPPNAPQQYSLKRYKVTIPVPAGYAIVETNAEVKVGSKLQACYAGRWEFVTVVAVNEDGTITCNWDNWKSFTYKMVREDLIIADRR